MDTAILDCGHNYGYNRKVMFPLTNVLMQPMNQIAYHKVTTSIEFIFTSIENISTAIGMGFP